MSKIQLAIAAVATMSSASAFAQIREVTVPVIAPITGTLAIEGASQVNGALLAIQEAPSNLKVTAEVIDSGAAAEGGANALEKVAGKKNVSFVMAPMFGTQVLAMLDVALENKISIMTAAGTASITEKNNPYAFMLSPNDKIAKFAQVRYAFERYNAKKFAIIYNETGYGQSGFANMSKYVKGRGGDIVASAGIELSAKDISAALAKVVAAAPDVVLLQMHAASVAMTMRQAAALAPNIPIVANSVSSMPTTAALLKPSDLKGVCAETGSQAVFGQTEAMDKFITTYKAKYGNVPDLYATHTYEGTKMALKALSEGAKNAADVQVYLSTKSYEGLARTLKSDGVGDLAQTVLMVCYDGTSLDPSIVKRYENVTEEVARNQ